MDLSAEGARIRAWRAQRAGRGGGRRDLGLSEIDGQERLAALDAIRAAKARYLRGVDTGDGDLVRAILARDCVLDYRGCCTDPASGKDFLPAMNVVLEGRDSWKADAFEKAGIVSVHQTHQYEIAPAGDGTAAAIFAFTDSMFFPDGAPYSRLVGHGFYHEDYVETGDGWQLARLRMTRLRVEAE